MLSTDAVVGKLGFEVAMFGQGKFSLGYDGLFSDNEKDNAVRAVLVNSRNFTQAGNGWARRNLTKIKALKRFEIEAGHG